jgi:hypothetical protein
VWRQEDLTLRGVGGMAHLQSNTLIPNGKAIWIVSGNNTVIENVEFSGARVVDTNGAGIRHEGGDLTLRNTYFHHNEFSVLTGADPDASLDVIASRFYFQRREGTFSHGIYVGELGRFTITGSHFKGTDRGHQIKSRALGKPHPVQPHRRRRQRQLQPTGGSLELRAQLYRRQRHAAVQYQPEP